MITSLVKSAIIFHIKIGTLNHIIEILLMDSRFYSVSL